MNRYNNDSRFVSAQDTQPHDTQWRVTGELLESDAATTNQYRIVDTMQQVTVAPRIKGDREDPLSRSQGFAVVSIPFTLITIILVCGLVTLAFTDKEFLGWLMTGVGGLALVVLAYVYHTNESNSPGAVDRHWANVERHKHDNDTDVRLEMVRAEKEIRLARLQLYRETHLLGGENAKSLPANDSSPKRLPGR